jgi:outer membrane protein
MKIPTSRVLASSVLLLLSVAATQAATPWSVRLRATYLSMADQSDAFTALGLHFGSGAVTVNDKLIPEIDVDYAFTDTISAELVLTVPQTQEVKLAGVGQLGTFKHLPPTLLIQYRGNPGGAIRPYVGAGVNYTLIWDDHLSVAGTGLSLENGSIGAAAQAGLDIAINEKWSANLDVKYVMIRSRVYAGSAELTQARLDPTLLAVGLRYQF